MGRSLIVALVLTVAALTASSAAFAAGSAQQTYGGSGGNVQADVQQGAKDPHGTSTASAETPGGLPFTGLDLTLMLGGALVLIASGVTLGRVAIRGGRV
jgi:Spy/CpxP family protein refolding chaperone